MDAVTVLTTIYGVFTLMAECQEVPPAFLTPNAYREDRSTVQKKRKPPLSHAWHPTQPSVTPRSGPRARGAGCR